MAKKTLALEYLTQAFNEKDINAVADKIANGISDAFGDGLEKSQKEMTDDIEKLISGDLGEVKKKLENMSKSMTKPFRKFAQGVADSYQVEFYKAFVNATDNDDINKVLDNAFNKYQSKMKALDKILKNPNMNSSVFENIRKTKELEQLIEKEERILKLNEDLERAKNEASQKSKSVLDNTEIKNLKQLKEEYSKVDKIKNAGNENRINSIKKEIQANEKLSKSQENIIKEYSDIISLYEHMDKNRPKAGTEESLKYSKQMQIVSEEIVKLEGKLTKFSEKPYSFRDGLDLKNPLGQLNESVKFFENNYVEKIKNKLSNLQESIENKIRQLSQETTDNLQKQIEKQEKRGFKVSGKSAKDSDSSSISNNQEVEQEAQDYDKASEALSKYNVEKEEALRLAKELSKKRNVQTSVIDNVNAEDIKDMIGYMQRYIDLSDDYESAMKTLNSEIDRSNIRRFEGKSGDIGFDKYAKQFEDIKAQVHSLVEDISQENENIGRNLGSGFSATNEDVKELITSIKELIDKLKEISESNGSEGILSQEKIDELETKFSTIASNFGDDLFDSINDFIETLDALDNRDWDFSNLKQTLLDIVTEFKNSLATVNLTNTQLDEAYKMLKGWNDADTYSLRGGKTSTNERGSFLNSKNGNASNSYFIDAEKSFSLQLYNALEKLSIGLNGEINSIYDTFVHSHPLRTTIEYAKKELKVVGSDIGFSYSDLDIAINDFLKKKINNMMVTNNYKYANLDLNDVSEEIGKKLLVEFKNNLLKKGLEFKDGKFEFPKELAIDGGVYNVTKKSEIINGALIDSLKNVGLEANRLTTGNIEDLKVDLSQLEKQSDESKISFKELLEVLRSISNVLSEINTKGFKFNNSNPKEIVGDIDSNKELEQKTEQVKDNLELDKVDKLKESLKIEAQLGIDENAWIEQINNTLSAIKKRINSIDVDININAKNIEEKENISNFIDIINSKIEAIVKEEKQMRQSAGKEVSSIKAITSAVKELSELISNVPALNINAKELQKILNNSASYEALINSQNGTDITLATPITALSDEWKQALEIAQHYNSELSDIANVTKQIRTNSKGERLISYKVTDNEGKSIIVGKNGKLISSTNKLSTAASDAKAKEKEDEKQLKRKKVLEEKYQRAREKFEKNRIAQEKNNIQKTQDLLKSQQETYRKIYEIKTKIALLDPDNKNDKKQIDLLNQQKQKYQNDYNSQKKQLNDLSKYYNKQEQYNILNTIANKGKQNISENSKDLQKRLLNEKQELQKLEEQNKKYEELENTVKEYGSLREHVARNAGIATEEEIKKIQELKKKIDSVSKEIYENDLYDSNKDSLVKNNLDSYDNSVNSKQQKAVQEIANSQIKAYKELRTMQSNLFELDSKKNSNEYKALQEKIKLKQNEIVKNQEILNQNEQFYDKEEQTNKLLKAKTETEDKIAKAKDKVSESQRKYEEQLLKKEQEAAEAQKEHLRKVAEAQKKYDEQLLVEKQKRETEYTSWWEKELNTREQIQQKRDKETYDQQVQKQKESYNELIKLIKEYNDVEKKNFLNEQNQIINEDYLDEAEEKLRRINELKRELTEKWSFGIENDNEIKKLEQSLKSYKTQKLAEAQKKESDKPVSYGTNAENLNRVNSLYDELLATMQELKRLNTTDFNLLSDDKVEQSVKLTQKLAEIESEINEELSKEYKKTDAIKEVIEGIVKLREKGIKNIDFNEKTFDGRQANVGIAFEEAEKINNALNRTNAEFDELSHKDIDNFERPFERANKKIEALNNELKSGKIDIAKYNEEAGKLKTQLNNIVAVLNSSSNIEDGQNAIDKYLNSISNNNYKTINTKVDNKGIITTTAEFVDQNKQLQRIKVSYNDITKEVSNFGKVGKENVGKFSKFIDELNRKFLDLAKYLISFVGFYEFTNMIKQGIGYIVEFDSAMTELMKVSQEAESVLKDFGKESYNIAQQVGSTGAQITQAAADWEKLGYNIKEASELAKNSAIYVNVGDGIDIETATGDIVSAMKAFDIQAENSISIIDKYNEVSNNFAISSSGIGEALARSSASLEMAGNTIDQSIAMATAMNEILQDESTVGQTLKTLSLRIRGAKTELEEAGESTDGMAESTSKLREQISALTNVDGTGGFDIMLNDKEFKSTYDIIEGIYQVWDKMDDIDQASLLELLSGKTRAQGLSALISNFGQAQKALETSLNSEGSALEENERYMQSIQGHLEQLKNSWQQLWNSDIARDQIVPILDIVQALLDVANNLGLIKSAAIAAGAALGTFYGIKNIKDSGGRARFYYIRKVNYPAEV